MNTELGTLRTVYRQEKNAISEGLRTPAASTRSIRSVLHKLSRLTDKHLCAIRTASGLPAEVALVAVGGYGREQLFPASDVDVLLLLPGTDTEAHVHLKTHLERFIGACWDAGLEIGSSVRTISECVAEATQDVTVQTAMLEARLIDGDAALFADFQQQYRAGSEPQGILYRQDAGVAPAPHQARRHALCAGAQLQRISRRLARSAHHFVGVASRRLGAHVARAGGIRHRYRV